MRSKSVWAKACLKGLVLASSLIVLTQNASALSLVEAARIAVESNPEIGQAIENREAVEFELKQALGLYLPRLELEASTGIRKLNNPSRRGSGIQDDPLYPTEVGLVATYDIWDGGFKQSESNRQAARVDSASFRVLERSEFIALQIAREYFEILLQSRIVGISRQNVVFHETTLSNVEDAVSSGQLTAADRSQALERLSSSRTRATEAQESLETAKIGFYKLVGVPFTKATMPGRVKNLPKNLQTAIGLARVNNPRVRLASADIDAAASVVEQSKSGLGPSLTLEGRASTGNDLGGTEGITSDLQGRLVMRWTLFDGGIKSNEVQENVRRESESMLALHQVHREVEEAVRISWERKHRQAQLVAEFGRQLAASENLVSSYREQFGVGQRSLLDVLDAQNTRYGVQVLSETAQFSVRFAEYRLLAATGTLLAYLNLEAPAQAEPYARELLGSPDVESYQPRARRKVDFNAPFDLTKFVN